MTDLADLLVRDAILAKFKGSGSRAVISELAGILAPAIGLDKHILLDALLRREHLGSTGIGQGVAVPHARLAEVRKPLAAFASLADPVDFDAMDGKFCDLIVMLAVPDIAGSGHLRALARVTRLMRQEKICRRLRDASTAKTILTVLAPSLPALTSDGKQQGAA